MKHTFYKICVAVILISGFFLRLYKIDNPVADWHSWRQADTAAVARNFLKTGIDPLHPRFDDLSNIPSGFDNPEGWRMVEFPFYQALAAAVSKAFPVMGIELSLRLISILASLGTALILIFLVSRYSGNVTGLAAGLIYTILPYSIYYGRTILPDGIMVFFSIWSIYCLDTYFRSRKNYLIWISMLLAALAVLVKPMAVFLLIATFYLFAKNFSPKKIYFFKIIVYYIFIGFVLWWWRVWISQFPEGIASFLWLFNQGNIRFKGAWFYWLFAERLGNLILGYWGLVLFVVGLTQYDKKESWLFRWLAFGSLLYLCVIARGNVQHDYYQILVLPVVSIYTAKGLVFMFTKISKNIFISSAVATVSFIFMLAFSWYTIRTYYWINRPEIVEAGKKADLILPRDAIVIAPYNGDTTFLYQINRKGWPIGFDIENKILHGAQYYVTVSPSDADLETKALAETYKVLVRNDKYAIIDLTQKAGK